MFFLILLPAFVLMGVGFAVRRRSETAGNVFAGLGVLVCIGAVIWQARDTVFTPKNRIPAQDAIALNGVLSGMVQQDIYGKKGIVLLVFPNEKSMKEQTLEDLRNSFRGVLLRGHPEWDVETARLQSATGSANEFKAAIAQAKDIVAVVSYAGVPEDIASALPGGAGSPSVFVFDPQGRTTWVAPLKQGKLRCVVVPRPDVDAKTRESIIGMPAENFGKLFYLATAANADQIASQLGNK